MVGILTEILSLITGGISTFASGIGTGIGAFVENLFVNVVEGTGGAADTYSLTLFGGLTIIFAGISLTIGLSRFVVNWLTSLGN